MKVGFLVCLVSVVSLVSGCATSYRVKLDSLAKPDANAISYALRNGNPTEKEDSLRYREAANLVRTALSGRGLFEAPEKVVPDVIVEINYGLRPIVRQEKRAKIQPPWERPSYEKPWGTETRTDENGNIVLVAAAPPRVEEETVSVTTYEKYLHLTARENASPNSRGNGPMLWRVDVTSEGQNKNLREYLPVLVAATIEYVGKDSRGEKTIRIKDTDADLVFVKKGM